MAAAHGLLQRARAYLDTQRRLVVVRQDDDGLGALPIRDADRNRILEEIEHEVAVARSPVTDALLAFTPRRRGSLLPLIVNLVAVAVIAGGVLGAIWLSRQREQAAASTATTLTTAEGKLLEALRQESEEQLADKDRQIADIRAKLAGLDGERDRIRADAEARIAARERELADSSSSALEAERRRLLETGLSEAAVTKRLADLEASLKTASERLLAEERQQAEADRLAQERAAEELQAEYQRSLAQAQTERSRIQEETARKQADLEAGYRQKQLALEQDKAAAVAELDALRRAQERERLVLDQFVSFYREVKDEIAAGRTDAALGVLGRFRAYLDDASVAVLPAVARRRAVELFLIGSLEEITRARATTATDAAATQSLVAAASLVAAVSSLVQEGEAAFADKDYAHARDVYLAALAKIPAVQTGTDRLADIERISAEQERRALDALFAEGNAAYLAGDLDRAADRYRRGLELLAGDRGIADALVVQLAGIGAIRERAAAAAAAPSPAEGGRDAVADEAARAELVAEIERLRTALASATAARDEAIAARDAAISATEAAVRERDAAVADREAAVKARDTALAERDQTAAERDQALFRLATAEDRRTASLAGLAAFRARAAQAATAGQAVSPEKLASLVETKVLVQKVLLSEAVLAEYPDLADRLDSYLEALTSESRGEAGIETLHDLDEVLAGLAAGRDAAAGQGIEISDEVVARRTVGDQRDLLLGILDKLKTLLE